MLTTSDSLELSYLDSSSVVVAKGETKSIPIYFRSSGNLQDGKATRITITGKIYIRICFYIFFKYYIKYFSAVGAETKVFQFASSTLVIGERKSPRINSLHIEATINAR